MKVLLTADLHYRLPWYRWLIEQAPPVDLVCIAGDLLDMLREGSRSWQAREVSALLKELAEKVPVALCSGNHDNAGKMIVHDRVTVLAWMMKDLEARGLITDGQTATFGSLVVSTIPYWSSKEQKKVLLDRGKTIRRQSKRQWLVLHHCPPNFGAQMGLGLGTLKSGGGESLRQCSGEEAEAGELLLEYQPDFWLSGHLHSYPYIVGQGPEMALGALNGEGVRQKTLILVPGQLARASVPNYMILDTESGTSTWHTESTTWIPEDGFYDHLLLKLK